MDSVHSLELVVQASVSAINFDRPGMVQSCLAKSGERHASRELAGSNSPENYCISDLRFSVHGFYYTVIEEIFSPLIMNPSKKASKQSANIHSF